MIWLMAKKKATKMAPHPSMVLTDPAVYEKIDAAAADKAARAVERCREQLRAFAADVEATGNGAVTAAGLRILANRLG